MTENEEPVVETIELTDALLQTLLNLTGGDVELHAPKKRALVRALHTVKISNGTRWKVRLDAEQMKTAKYHLDVWFLEHPENKTRFTRYLRMQSDVYRRLCEEEETACE